MLEVVEVYLSLDEGVYFFELVFYDKKFRAAYKNAVDYMPQWQCFEDIAACLNSPVYFESLKDYKKGISKELLSLF